MGKHIIIHRQTPTAHRGSAKVVERPDWTDEWWKPYFPDADGEHVAVFPLYGATMTPVPLSYHWSLSGPDGAHFDLFVPLDTAQEDVDRAKRFLRNSYDVTFLTIWRLDFQEHEPGETGALLAALDKWVAECEAVADRLESWGDSARIWHQQTGSVETRNMFANYGKLVAGLRRTVEQVKAAKGGA